MGSESEPIVFNTLAGFSPEAIKKRPLVSQKSLLVNFREESRGIGRFCRLEFQRIANWPGFDLGRFMEDLPVLEKGFVVRCVRY